MNARLRPDCTCREAWAKRPDVRIGLAEHHPDCAREKWVAVQRQLIKRNRENGSAILIDEANLGPDGWKLVGGIEALNAAEMTIKSIREKSTVVQERMFLAEIADLLRQFAEQHQAKLVALAMQNGAGQLRDIPKEAKPN